MKTYKVFYLFTISIFAVLLLPTLVQDGMFLDGVTYSSISKNLSNGIGSFWKPHYTRILYPEFYEHPPLVFGIQSLFFSVLGDGIYTERIFTLLTAILTAVGIILNWHLFTESKDIKRFAWIPVLLWISIPLVFWSYQNNLLENTLGVFTIFSIYFISKALFQQRILYLIPGSILVVLAFFSKGFVGLFPIVAVPIYYLALEQKSKITGIIYGFVSLILPISLIYLIFLLSPEAKVNFGHYIHQQLIPALSNQREITTENHLWILSKLIIELSLPIIIVIALFIRQIKIKLSIDKTYNRIGIYFILLGISASFPLIISLKQRAFYLIPSIPFFILGISFLILPFLKFLETLSKPIVLWINRLAVVILLFTSIYSIFNIGKYSRDEAKLRDIYTLSKHIPNQTIIQTTPKIWNDWAFVAYMSRIGDLSLDTDNEHTYYLCLKNDKVFNGIDEKYTKLELDLKLYVLLKQK
ncbi:MAG: glycosyltransferase family 39 protein [Bacteroidales bacterium]|jgi:4-amino-4-deoxy-L-arabinose transferase-like glycosyltransferase|nr:glycosyltransferase family 39 protein [Bacteroidales bacterium]